MTGLRGASKAHDDVVASYAAKRAGDAAKNFTAATKTVAYVVAKPVLVDKDTACRLLGGIAERKLMQLVQDGELNAKKLGTRTVFELDELQRFGAELPDWEPKQGYE
jgi:hypothetical protein